MAIDYDAIDVLGENYQCNVLESIPSADGIESTESSDFLPFVIAGRISKFRRWAKKPRPPQRKILRGKFRILGVEPKKGPPLKKKASPKMSPKCQ